MSASMAIRIKPIHPNISNGIRSENSLERIRFFIIANKTIAKHVISKNIDNIINYASTFDMDLHKMIQSRLIDIRSVTYYFTVDI